MSRVTRAEFARLAGVNRSTVTRWIENGRIEADAHGLIDPVAAAKMREATESPMPHHQARKAQFDEAKAGHSPTDTEKTAHSAPQPAADAVPAMEKIGAALKLETYKLQKAKAEMAAMEVDKLAGALVERAEVDYILADFGNTLRSTLESLPDRLAPAIAAHRGDVSAIHKTLEETAHDALHEMADLIRRKMDGLT